MLHTHTHTHIYRLCSLLKERVSSFLALILPVLVSRLGSDEITEPSEEIRLQLLILLDQIIQTCTNEMAPYLDDILIILQHTIVDPYPEVKKVSCYIAHSHYSVSTL